MARELLREGRTDTRVKLLCLILYFIAALHARTFGSLALCLAVAVAVAVVVNLSPRMAIKAVRPLAVILVFTVVAQVLYIQQGPTLIQLGPVAVTQGALAAACGMVVSLVCVVTASVSFMRCTLPEQLVAAFGWLLSPLRPFGMSADAFMLALSVAFRFVPVLVGDFHQLKNAQAARLARFDGGIGARLAAYTRLFPPLVRSSFRRADHLAESFLARCFGNSADQTTLHESRIGLRDALLLAVTLAITATTFII